MPRPRKFVFFRLSEMASGAFSGTVFFTCWLSINIMIFLYNGNLHSKAGGDILPRGGECFLTFSHIFTLRRCKRIQSETETYSLCCETETCEVFSSCVVLL